MYKPYQSTHSSSAQSKDEKLVALVNRIRKEKQSVCSAVLKATDYDVDLSAGIIKKISDSYNEILTNLNAFIAEGTEHEEDSEYEGDE